ncbi:MAG: class I SAM-dependent methyltransferase [Desulfarculales bacterium]|nr:class I SAM-dependent methyltransferase [Desulfarculales bacterium]
MIIPFSTSTAAGNIDMDTPSIPDGAGRILTGWICSKASIAGVELVCGTSRYTAKLSHGRDDVIAAMKGGYPKENIYGFELEYQNSTSLFNYDDIDVRIIIKHADESSIASECLRPAVKDFLHGDIAEPRHFSHARWMQDLVALCDKPGASVLEIGSRKINSPAPKDLFVWAEYVGFDIYPGENVDVVGDAHNLGKIFGGKRFDLIFSSAVFEHLAMPWVVSKHIIKLLNVGGYVFVETHFSYSSHERPWHFFQFSDMALSVLFPEALGIRRVDAGLSNPILGFFSPCAASYLANKPVTGLYCHAEFFGKKEKEIADVCWENLGTKELVMGTCYPAPQTRQNAK